MNKRKQNERKFINWKSTETDGRLYWYEVTGRMGWTARYIKEVDKNEKTLRFLQKIYDENGNLIEIHEKYPIDKGHKKI